MKRKTGYNLNLIATVVVALSGIAAVALADDATLRDGVRVDAEAVTLGDIAVLEGDYAATLAEIEIARFKGESNDLRLTRLTVREKLTAAGVHWGKLSLRGHQTITVTRPVKTVPGTISANDQDAVAGTISAEAGEAKANPVADAALAEPSAVAPNDQTLKQAITDWIMAATGIDKDDVRISYYNETDAAWSLRQGTGRFEIEPQTTNAVGRVPFNIRRYVGEELAETEYVRVDVQIRRPVLMVERNIQRGQIITDADLKRQSLWLESLDPTPAAADVDAAVGQQADRTMKPGHILRADDLAAPEMVKRGQLMTVRAISGGLVIRTVARAGESGHLNQLIEARNPKTRDVFHVRVTGPQEAVMVIDSPTTIAQPAGES